MTEVEPDVGLDRVEALLPRVRKIVQDLPANLQPVGLEVLLNHILHVAVSPRVESTVAATRAVSGSPVPLGPARWSAFLRDFDISPTDVERLINMNTGEVLARNLGRSGADIQRRVAALRALWKCSQGQEMSVTSDEVMAEARRFGVDDSANLASNIKRATWKDLSVFSLDNGEWKVTKSGEEFVADVVKTLIGTTDSGTSS